jgi:hypothetical protein
VLPDFQRGKAVVPAAFALFGDGSDILHHDDADRKELAELARHAQFPLPACSGRGRQFPLAVLAVLAWLAARSRPPPARPTLAGRVFLSVLDPRPGLSLDVEKGMSG